MWQTIANAAPSLLAAGQAGGAVLRPYKRFVHSNSSLSSLLWDFPRAYSRLYRFEIVCLRVRRGAQVNY